MRKKPKRQRKPKADTFIDEKYMKTGLSCFQKRLGACQLLPNMSLQRLTSTHEKNRFYFSSKVSPGSGISILSQPALRNTRL